LRRTPNQTRARETMDAILLAASAEIERVGLDRLTTKRIAAAAGVSVGALYEYFPNKEAVVFALVTQWLERVYGVLDRFHPRHGGCLDVLGYLAQSLDAMIVLYQDQPGLGSLITIISSMPQVRDAVREHDARTAATTADALSHFAPRADPRVVTATARSLAIFGHETLCEALVRKAADGDALIENYKVCAFALASRLFAAGLPDSKPPPPESAIR
jgi:AcrR family transcriptional regulator